MTARLSGGLSLALLSLYTAALLAAAPLSSFSTLEPFPLGGVAGQSPIPLKLVALALGIVLGWGIPGVPLALMRRPEERGAALLASALGLGVGYIFVSGFGYAIVTGHAPHRLATVVLIGLPCAAAILLPSRTRTSRQAAFDLVVTFLAMAALMAILWPKVRFDGMNGDGTEAYELARSLEANRLPRWDMEGPAGGRFGTPITVPLITAAYPIFGEMAILGRSEVAIRVPFVASFVLLVALAVGLAKTTGRFSMIYVVGVSLVYLLWNAFYVGYEPPLDLAEPAGTDTLTTALWLAGFWEIVAGSPAFGIAFMALASGTTLSAPLLTAFAVAAFWVVEPARAWRVTVSAVAAGIVLGGTLALVGWYTGDWSEWVRQFQTEYWRDLVAPESRVPWAPLLGFFLLMTGGLPLVMLWSRGKLSASGRLLSLTGLAYLVTVLAGSYKNLHYLMPLPWIFLAPALEVSSSRLRLAASAVLASALVLSWPDDFAVRRETVELGTQSCVSGVTYEEAALAADPVYKAFDIPAFGERFGVGKHTFVRYALDVGGSDCMVGLSRTVPEHAIALVDGPVPLWITDPDRYAQWRFARSNRPTSWLFPRRTAPTHSADPAAWQDRLVLSETPARWLLVSGFSTRAGRAIVNEPRARLLVPVAGLDTRQVRIGIAASRAAQISVRMNGASAPDLIAAPGDTHLDIQGPWRRGWNVLELSNASDIELDWIEASPAATR